MAKISIDIDQITKSLEKMGYIISDKIERDNNGTNWQLKFSNSGAIATVYDTNKKKNTVVNGKCEEGESEALKEIIEGLKSKELQIDDINSKIVDLINSQKEDYYYDFKREWVTDQKKGDLLHDILCLANNLENREAYLIIGVTDAFEVIGVNEWKKSNEIFDWLRTIEFAGDKEPEIDLKKIYYKYKKIDVLVLKKSNNIPLYIEKNYKGVNSFQIYTRVGDTNTPKTSQACYAHVEKLWKMHFNNEE
jgi:hypothetical protein